MSVYNHLWERRYKKNLKRKTSWKRSKEAKEAVSRQVKKNLRANRRRAPAKHLP